MTRGDYITTVFFISYLFVNLLHRFRSLGRQPEIRVPTWVLAGVCLARKIIAITYPTYSIFVICPIHCGLWLLRFGYSSLTSTV
jgi:hypothetical protein